MDDLPALVSLAETLAALKAEGRLTLLRFPGGWKIGLGHPDLALGGGVNQVVAQPVYPTLREALRALVIEQVHIDG